jgi:glycosyltransferase involved in cell wall biosynthesis
MSEPTSEPTAEPTREPLVSIVIPVFAGDARQLALLDETLATVDAQTYSHYEAIVVDDGSPVEVPPVVARHPRTKTVRRANAGCAMARNTGIAASRGGCLVFLDADDHLLPGAVASGVREFGAHPGAGFVVGAREEMTYEGAPVPWTIPSPPQQSWLYETLLAFDWYIIPPSSAMFAREAVNALGGFRGPSGADDLDFYLRAAWKYPGWCYATPVTRYRRYSTSSSRDGERMLVSMRAVYERQRHVVIGHAELEAAFDRGLARLTDIFVDCLVENVRDRLAARQWSRALRSAALLAREDPARMLRTLASLPRGVPGEFSLTRRPAPRY